MEEKSVSILFPNQLFLNLPKEIASTKIFIIEEYIFFKQYNFNLNRLVFNRLSILEYCNCLKKQGIDFEHIRHDKKNANLKNLFHNMKAIGVSKIFYIDPVDDYLSKKILKYTNISLLASKKFDNKSFLLGNIKEHKFFSHKKVYRHSEFYKQQRLDYGILINGGKPIGGKWSFDKDNRLKYPFKKVPPALSHPKSTLYKNAVCQIRKEFPKNIGFISENQIYPSTHKEADAWLDEFLRKRFFEFGSYEDAIVKENIFLHHSVISPMLNIGLITPDYVIDKALGFAKSNGIPMNSLEGFIRQILGWREFIRGMYEIKGNLMRTKNYWGFSKDLPRCFYNGQTGIPPVDDSISKALNYGYNHHIERLMVLGNFMLLCEINPNEVYRWFMELYVDSYDWVMVPNVYGMSQFSDGGLFATKPYISSSNYILKMSNYKKGDWCIIWDSLFWRFMNKHRNKFVKNPRMNMLMRNFDSKNKEEKKIIEKTACQYLNCL